MDKTIIINNIVGKMTDYLSTKAMAVLVDAISYELSAVNIVDKLVDGNTKVIGIIPFA